MRLILLKTFFVYWIMVSYIYGLSPAHQDILETSIFQSDYHQVVSFLDPNPIHIEKSDDILIWDGKSPLLNLLNDPNKQVIVLMGLPDDTGTVKNLGRPGDNDPNVVFQHFFDQIENPNWNQLKIVYLGNILPAPIDPSRHPMIRADEFGDRYRDNLEDTYQRVKDVMKLLLEINPSIKMSVVGGDNGLSYPSFYAYAGNTGLVALDNHLDAKTLNPGRNNTRLPGSHSGNYVTQKFDPDNPGKLKPTAVKIFGIDPQTGHYPHRRRWLKKQGVLSENLVHVRDIQKLSQAGEWLSYILNQMGEVSQLCDHWHAMLDIDTIELDQAPGRSAKANVKGDLLGKNRGVEPKVAIDFAYAAGLGGASLLDITEVAPRYDHDDHRTSYIAANALISYLNGWHQKRKYEQELLDQILKILNEIGVPVEIRSLDEVYFSGQFKVFENKSTLLRGVQKNKIPLESLLKVVIELKQLIFKTPFLKRMDLLTISPLMNKSFDKKHIFFLTISADQLVIPLYIDQNLFKKLVDLGVEKKEIMDIFRGFVVHEFGHVAHLNHGVVIDEKLKEARIVMRNKLKSFFPNRLMRIGVGELTADIVNVYLIGIEAYQTFLRYRSLSILDELLGKGESGISNIPIFNIESPEDHKLQIINVIAYFEALTKKYLSSEALILYQEKINDYLNRLRKTDFSDEQYHQLVDYYSLVLDSTFVRKETYDPEYLLLMEYAA